MILVDDRVGSKEMLPIIQRMGKTATPRFSAELNRLEYGDACFDGHGPHGIMTVGIERKTLNDMLGCIEDARYVGQHTGMRQMYNLRFLLVEGLYCCGDGNGYDGALMQGFNKGGSWGPLRHRTSRTTLYAKLQHYLFTVMMGGAYVLNTYDIVQSSVMITALYRYFNKQWDEHQSLLVTQDIAIPTLAGQPSLCMEWAARLPGVGVQRALEADRIFKTGHALAVADESQWLRIPRLGAATARNIVRTIRGWK